MYRIIPKLFLICLVCSLSGCEQPSKASANSPNIILIVVDDLGWTDLGCYGSSYYETPNIDALREGGMKFSSAYAASAVCSPTRAAIMTGRSPARVGITDWIHHADPRVNTAIATRRNPRGYDPGKNRKLLTPVNKFWLEHEEITIAELLKAKEYATGYVGKWHLGPEMWFPENQGFDFNAGGCQFGQPPSYFDPYTNQRFPQGIPTLPSERNGEYLTDREGKETLTFIRANKDRPFFLTLANYAVHSPLQAKEEITAKYAAKAATNQNNPIYAAMIESIDQAVGNIVTTLKDHDIFDNTIIIFTSDNGGAVHFSATDNQPLRKGKGYPYEGGIRVPLIISWPGIVAAGSSSDAPVISMDIFPTLAEAAGVNLPKDRIIDGVTLLPLLTGKSALNRQTLYWHFPHYWWGTRIKPYSIIREGKWKLIHYYESDSAELFNLEADLSEKTDLAKEMPAKAEALHRKLINNLSENGSQMPAANSDFKLKEKQ